MNHFFFLPNCLLILADKNPHRAEEATDKFKEIQNAYSILSDPNERSWYDNHRDSILKGVEEGDEVNNKRKQQANYISLPFLSIGLSWY